MNTLIYLSGAIFIIIFVVSSIMIYNYLKNRGEKVNFLLLRLMLLSYASKYRELTKQETGKTGILFYLWIISINAALLCFILFLTSIKFQF
jgi:hypothetical protein